MFDESMLDIIKAEVNLIIGLAAWDIKQLNSYKSMLIQGLSFYDKAARRTQEDLLPLSSLVKCKRCGHTMSVYKRSDRKTQHALKPCWYVDELEISVGIGECRQKH